MRVLIGAYSDEGRFPERPPVDGAEQVSWLEARPRVRLDTEDRHAPNKSVMCTAWALEVDSIEALIALLRDWESDVGSFEVFTRMRRTPGPAIHDLCIILLDYDGDDTFRPQVVREVMR